MLTIEIIIFKIYYHNHFYLILILNLLKLFIFQGFLVAQMVETLSAVQKTWV